MKTMKLFFDLTFLFFTSITIFSCSSNNTAGGQVSPNGSVTVKYEIILSSPLTPISPTSTQPVQILYNNSTAQNEFAYDFNYGTSTWTKTFNLTASRPCFASLESDGLYMSTPGTVTANIYVNGVVKATQTNPTQVVSGIYFAIVQLNYFIQ